MERVEYAPDDELHEKLEFEWPEETGLTLDDFDVYKMWGRDGMHQFQVPLWVAVCEPSTCVRQLVQRWDYNWLFIAANKPLDEIEGLYFVQAAITQFNFDFLDRMCKGWYLPLIAPRGVTGYLFKEDTDALLYKMWRDAPIAIFTDRRIIKMTS